MSFLRSLFVLLSDHRPSLWLGFPVRTRGWAVVENAMNFIMDGNAANKSSFIT